MSSDDGAARAPAGPDWQHTPLFDLAPVRGTLTQKRTLPRGLGAPTTRAPLLCTPAVDREDIGTERRRRNSGSVERRTLRWERTPSPQVDGRQSPSTLRDRFIAGSATYQPTYKTGSRDKQTHPRTATPNHATGLHTCVQISCRCRHEIWT